MNIVIFMQTPIQKEKYKKYDPKFNRKEKHYLAKLQNKSSIIYKITHNSKNLKNIPRINGVRFIMS